MAVYQTQQKKLLLMFLSENPETPFSVEELAAAISERCGENAPGKSTVYRLINKLVENGTVKRFVKGNSRHFLYQLAGHEDCHRHLHMKCMSCGKLFHMNNECSEELIKQIFGDTDFEVDSDNTTLFGCCGSCKKQNADCI